MTNLQMVLEVMQSGEALTLWDIRQRIADKLSILQSAPSETGISARIRDLRKSKFGGYEIVTERIPGKAYPKYRLVLPLGQQELFRRVA